MKRRTPGTVLRATLLLGILMLPACGIQGMPIPPEQVPPETVPPNPAATASPSGKDQTGGKSSPGNQEGAKGGKEGPSSSQGESDEVPEGGFPDEGSGP